MTDEQRVLLAAAERAEVAASLPKAITSAWSALHADTADVMSRCFALWAEAEEFRYHPSGLGKVLRRRYGTPSEIGGSLRRAADLAAAPSPSAGSTRTPTP